VGGTVNGTTSGTMTDVDLADVAGLVRVSGDEPGIRRVRRGRGFSYVSPSGAPVDAAERARIRSLAIPPAWRDVWIAPWPEAHILATGVDDADRKQYLYHPQWRVAADAVKFDRLATFPPALVRLRRDVVRRLSRRVDDSPEGLARTVPAVLVRLLDQSLIRAGSRCYAESNGTHGATTLLASHVELHGDRVHLEFPGKGGRDHEIDVRDPLLARHLGVLVELAGEEDAPLFSLADGAVVGRNAVNGYIASVAGAPYSAKDFRTWGATCVVAERLAAADDGDGAAVRDAIEVAADALGNTPTVCRQSYVAPAVIDAFEEGVLRSVWRTARRSRWLSRAERATARVLASTRTGGTANGTHG
jgi:DNA topoisomerase-1